MIPTPGAAASPRETFTLAENMKLYSFLISLGLLICGCTRLSDEGFAREKLKAHAQGGKSIDLSDYTLFEWDRLYIFPPYTPSETIKEEVGSAVSFPNASSESHCLLVFLSGQEIVSAFELERQPVDFAELFQEGGYSRSEAVFVIDVRGPDRWRYLKKRT